MASLKSLGQRIEQLGKAIRQSNLNSQASLALLLASVAEEWLARRLTALMRPLSKAQRQRLFENYGPLSSFAAKIDLAYAFRIIDDTQRIDLNAARKIRNEFAHALERVNFDTPEIRALFDSFSCFSAATVTNVEQYYVKKLLGIIEQIKIPNEQPQPPSGKGID